MESTKSSSNLAENGNKSKPLLPAVTFSFLFRKKSFNSEAITFTSKKTTLDEAMNDFLTKKSKIYDIDEEVEVTYEDGSKEFLNVDSRQDWDSSFYFILDKKMIYGNDYVCAFNGR